MRIYSHMDSPIGRILIGQDEAGLRLISFCEGKKAYPLDGEWQEGSGELIDEAMRQLRAYFAGELKEFDLKLAPEGTPFQQAVWQALDEIPYGETISYGELARRVERPKASRAVGAANGRNPLPIVLPCHRVIGSNGDLTGYGGGLRIKETLLSLERQNVGVETLSLWP